MKAPVTMRATLVLAAALIAGWANAATLCIAPEKPFFSCELENARTVSLCMGKDDVLRYRYGKPGTKPELVYPTTALRPEAAFKEAHDDFPKGGSQAVGFSIGPFSYSVFETRSVFGFNGKGVIVGRDGKRVQVLRCRAKSPPNDDFFFFRGDNPRIPAGAPDYLGAESGT